MQRLIPLLLLLLTLALAAPAAATPTAFTTLDTAADAVYDDGWQNGDDNSPNSNSLGPWQLTTSGNAGFFVFTSAQNGNGNSGNIDTAGRAWGMFANSGGISQAARSFPYPVANGDVISIQMDNGFIDNGSSTRVEILNSTSQVLANFRFVGGASSYELVDASGTINTGLPFSTDGLSLTFTRGAGNAFTFAAAVNGGGTFNTPATFASPSGGSVPQAIRLINQNAGNGSSNNLYFNTLSVTYNSLDVQLADFRAEATPDGVQLAWETASESNLAGWHLYRAADPAATPLRITGELLPAQGAGFAYTWLDTAPTTPAFYWLESVDSDGSTARYGPVSPEAPTAVSLATLTTAPTLPAPALPVALIALGAGLLVLAWRRVRG